MNGDITLEARWQW